MRAADLRTVLLIQAIEETDPAGELLPLPDRSEATREAVKDTEALKQAFMGGRLSRAAERVMTARARQLRGKIRVRSPVLDQILHPAHAPRWIAQALFVTALLFGVGLSLLDGVGRIDILPWPLVLLIIWNLFVYVRGLSGAKRNLPGANAYAVLIQRHARGLVAQSARFHAPLTDALERFASVWGKAATPLIAQQGRRLLHIAALCVAIGLIAGWSLRGMLFRDEAGWESSFLAPRVVLWFVHLLYGPAAALLGIDLPASVPEMQQLRWSAINPLRASHTWVHLLVATAVLYIVVPRLIALSLSTTKRWRLARHVTAPRSLVSYTRGVLLNLTELGTGVASVTPYAYTPDHHTLEGLENVLGAALGGAVLVDVRPSISYGAAHQDAPAAADWTVVLCTLASTPEVTAHGAYFAASRNRLLEGRSHAPLLIAVDESPLEKILGPDSAASSKLAERRKLWSDFVADLGLPVCILSFGRYRRGAAVDTALVEQIQAAFWTPAVAAS